MHHVRSVTTDVHTPLGTDIWFDWSTLEKYFVENNVTVRLEFVYEGQIRIPYGVVLRIWRSRARPSERCLTTVRIAGDVEAVALVLHEVEPREERHVEERRRELSHPAPDLILVDALGDRRREHEALLFGALPHQLVDREDLAEAG